MRLSVSKFSGRGGREINEDYLGFCGNEVIGCFVLADGAGGHEGGAIASKTVVQQVLKAFSLTPTVSREMAQASIATARTALNQARCQHPDKKNMNTTLAILLLDVDHKEAYWAHLGDSRIYLLRKGRAYALTRDHSILQSMIDAGLTQGTPRGSAERNTLYASVGSTDIPDRTVCEAPLALQMGDAFLLCSDGFWESVDEGIMETTLRLSNNSEQWLQSMLAYIAEPSAETQDNFSALGIWLGDQEEATRIQRLS
mgnify:CR=1 FL=1